MTSKAAKLKHKRISRGRPRKEGAERHPCGKIKQDWSQQESEKDAMSVAMVARGRIHGLNENNALAGYTLGRIFLDGKIQQHQREAGDEYAEEMVRYYRLTGIPFPSARAQSIGGIRGSDGEVSQTRAEAARRASNRFMQLEGLLLRCEEGPQVKMTVYNVCVMDYEVLRTMSERQMLWLRRGLDALHVDKHLRKSAA